MIKIIQCLLVVTAIMPSSAQNLEAPSWVDYTSKRANGDLKNSVLLDYSYAGYHFSEDELPDVSSWNTVSVIDFGATPNDDTYDDLAIYAAIDAAKAANAPTVIYFPAGRYIVSSEATRNTPFIIDKSYIVLKGAGSGAGGTEIYTDKFGDNPEGPDYPWRFQFTSPNPNRDRITTVNHAIYRGDYEVRVANTSNLSAGMNIELFHIGNETIQSNMPNQEMNPIWTGVVDNGIVPRERHVIEKIEGNTVTFKNPIKINIPGDISEAVIREFNTIEEVGLEDILFTSGWKSHPETFVHHASDLVDYAWRAVTFEYVFNSWVKNVEFKDWNEAFRVRRSMGVTVKDITVSGKRGHVSYFTSRSYGILFEDCKDIVEGGQHHGPGVFAPSTGTVFLRSQMQQGQSIDCHATNPYGNLYDDVLGGTFRNNGGRESSIPHHAQDLVLWNFVHNMDAVEQHYDFWSLSRRRNYTFYEPKFVGFTAPGETVTFENEGLDELRGEQVYPQSIFEAQLQLRLYGGYMTASSEKAAFKAKFANDDKTETSWQSANSGVGEWLLLDLGINKLVSGVTINELTNGVNEWELEYWNGTGWENITIDNTIGAERIINFEAVNTRKIRFNVISMLAGQENAVAAITGFTTSSTNSDDADNDGVLNSDDLCPDTPEGTIVNEKGCEIIQLPSNNFTIVTTGETCIDKGNGQVVIHATQSMDYTAIIDGIDYDFTTNTAIDNLVPGDYDLCIGISGSDFEQCYKITIEGGINLTGKIAISKDGQSARVEVDHGTAPYTVFVNGNVMFETHQSSFSVPIKQGDELQVSSKSACEGVLSTGIELLEDIKAYPNPSTGLFEINIPNSIETIDVAIYNLLSQLMVSNTYAVAGGKININIQDRPSGIYFIKVNMEKPVLLRLLKQ